MSKGVIEKASYGQDWPSFVAYIHTCICPPNPRSLFSAWKISSPKPCFKLFFDTTSSWCLLLNQDLCFLYSQSFIATLEPARNPNCRSDSFQCHCQDLASVNLQLSRRSEAVLAPSCHHSVTPFGNWSLLASPEVFSHHEATRYLLIKAPSRLITITRTKDHHKGRQIC